jgi:hypothetical protein
LEQGLAILVLLSFLSSGKYPELELATEKRLEAIHPDSAALRVAKPILRMSELGAFKIFVRIWHHFSLWSFLPLSLLSLSLLSLSFLLS